MHLFARACLASLLVGAVAAQEKDRDYVIGFKLDGQPVVVERKGQKIEVKRDGKPVDAKIYSVDGDGRVYRFVDRDGEEAAVVELDKDGARVRSTYGDRSAPRLGVSLGPVDEALAEHLDLDAGEALQVEDLVDDFPAQKAGLRKNDVITAIDGSRPVTMDRVQELLGKKKWGDTVALEVARKSGHKKIDVKLDRPRSAATVYQSLLGDHVTNKPLIRQGDLKQALGQLKSLDTTLQGIDLKSTIDQALKSLPDRYDSKDLEKLSTHLNDQLRKSQVDFHGQLKTALDQAKLSLQGLDGLSVYQAGTDLLGKRYLLKDDAKGDADLFTKTYGAGNSDVGDQLRKVESRIDRMEKKLDQVLKGLQKND